MSRRAARAQNARSRRAAHPLACTLSLAVLLALLSACSPDAARADRDAPASAPADGAPAAAPAADTGSDALAVAPKTDGTLGVARFEGVTAGDEAVPDVAALLVERLRARGMTGVVGPDRIELARGATAEQTAAAGRAAGVQALVTGRTTRLGGALSLDAVVRDVSTDGRGDAFYASAETPSELPAAVDALATQLLARLDAPAEPARGPVAAAGRGSGAGFDRDAPISIQSDSLEAAEQGGRRTLLFTGKVRARQGDVALRADRLEAFYPPGASQPERLVASGGVEFDQGGRHAACDRATFFRTESRVVCVGNARLEQGCDEVRGDQIVFHLDREVLSVQGGAGVRIHPRGSDCAAQAASR